MGLAQLLMTLYQMVFRPYSSLTMWIGSDGKLLEVLCGGRRRDMVRRFVACEMAMR